MDIRIRHTHSQCLPRYSAGQVSWKRFVYGTQKQCKAFTAQHSMPTKAHLRLSGQPRICQARPSCWKAEQAFNMSDSQLDSEHLDLRSWFKHAFALGVVSLVLCSPAWAIPGEGMAGLVGQVLPDQVTSAVSSAVDPVAQKTAAFIPGLIGDSPLREGIVSGFLLILFSELGDKTFFLALLLALKENKALIFAGTFGALAVMSVISVLLGQVVHQIDELGLGPNNLPLDDVLACILLVFFGVQTIQDARKADDGGDGEREEAEEEVSKFKQGATGLLLSTFALVFAAEWGDKSFLATIALAAASSPVGVTIGAVAGHGVATGVAVLGGSYLGKYLDEKVVQYLGGTLFLVFAAATAIDIVRGV